MAKLLVLLSAVSAANALDVNLRASIASKLAVEGARNCPYKCGLMWNQRQDWSRAGGFFLNEYGACLEGCNTCNGGEAVECMSTCKSQNWASYTYTFNSARALKKIDNTDEAQPLVDCLNSCVTNFYPIPATSTNFDGRLPKDFTGCTKGCYTTHLDACQKASIEKCQLGASASCTDTDADCYTADQCGFGLEKGVVEPDKACIQGCSQNLCQAGANCNGRGYWLPGGTPDTRGCQLITPQTKGLTNTITPNYFGQQNDLGDCCNAALQRCTLTKGVADQGNFGVSLGHVIATSPDQCYDDTTDSIYGGIIEDGGNYNCNCKAFFDQCPGAMEAGSIPDNMQCYYDDGNKSCSKNGYDAGTETCQ